MTASKNRASQPSPARIAVAKRLLDVTIALVAMVVLSPLFALAALGVLALMGRPVLYRQSRPGWKGRRFAILKFRSMHSQPPGRPELSDVERLTGFGRFLRRTSVDELPALINVIRGQMSLVGPRPLLERYQPYFSMMERHRFEVLPGLTGLAQVRGRNRRNWDSRLADDLEYVRCHGAMVDLRILVRTLEVAMLGRGMEVDPTSCAPDLDVERASLVRITQLGTESVDRVAALLASAYDRRLMPCSPVFAPGFSSIVRGWVEAGDRLIGLLHFGELAALAHLRAIQGAVHVNHFVVDPAHQGWGISDLLLSSILQEAYEQRVTLHVDERNERAVRFYNRFGFRVASREPFVLCDVDFGSTVAGSSHFRFAASGEIEPAGFCRVSLLGSNASFTRLSGDRIFLGREFPISEVLTVGRWLRRGRIVMPKCLKPAEWCASESWTVLSMERDSSALIRSRL